MNIYLSNPDHTSIRAATVRVKPEGVTVNGLRVMAGPSWPRGSGSTPAKH